MCGLAGLLLQPKARSDSCWQAIRTHFRDNLLANEERGRDATGVAVVRLDGSVAMYKVEVPSSAYVRSPGFARLMDSLDERVTCVLGHTRLPTKGTPDNPLNNHPIQVGQVLGIHNGHIRNDDSMFSRFHLPRHAQVDSEIIFQFLDLLDPELLAQTYLQHAANVISVLSGNMAVLALDMRLPDRLLVIKAGSPLSVYDAPEWGALTFSSRYVFLRKTFGYANEALPNNSITWFHAPTQRQLAQLSLHR